MTLKTEHTTDDYRYIIEFSIDENKRCNAYIPAYNIYFYSNDFNDLKIVADISVRSFIKTLKTQK